MLQTEKVITRVAEADNEDVDAAVKAARKAFDEGAWPRTPGAQRARVLNKCASLPAALQVTSSREFAAAAADFAVIASYCVCNCASSSRCCIAVRIRVPYPRISYHLFANSVKRTRPCPSLHTRSGVERREGPLSM